MKIRIFKTFNELGNFIHNYNIFYTIKKEMFNIFHFYKIKSKYLKNKNKKNNNVLIFFLYLKYNYLIYFYLKHYFIKIKYIKKQKPRETNNVTFYLQKISYFYYCKVFIICCKKNNNFLKNYGLSFYRYLSKKKSFNNLLKTILL